MHREEQNENRPPDAATIARGHESDTVGAQTYVVLLGIFVVCLMIVLAIVWGLMNNFAHRQIRSESQRRSPLAVNGPNVPPGPLLEPSPAQSEPRQPWQDMQAFRMRENETLTTYGQPSADGSVRIPIDRAMQIFISRATTRPSYSDASGGAR